MKVSILNPSGFCFGVRKSYEKTLEIIEQNPNVRIFMMGWLVHNKAVIDEFISKGVFILDDQVLSRKEIIDSLEYKQGDIIIFSAHGTDFNVIEIARKKGFNVFDLTCPFVLKTHKIIKKKLNEGYEIIFIGKCNHPETNAILSIDDKKIHLIKQTDEVKSLNISSAKLFCTNQTTLSHYEVNDIYCKLKNKFLNIEFENDICNATTLRQQALINLDNSVDVCIIVGDKRSSNSNELLKIASNKVDAYMISYGSDIKNSWFENKKHCAIIGAASCNQKLVEDIKIYIEEICG